MNATQLAEFCKAHRLPDSFRRVVSQHYVPLARWLRETSGRRPSLIGICGAQGTGKSTLAEFLALQLGNTADWTVAVLSMDDFYLSRSERLELSGRVHPLLATRGPPGTHDCEMMDRYLRRLGRSVRGRRCACPGLTRPVTTGRRPQPGRMRPGRWMPSFWRGGAWAFLPRMPVNW